MCFCGNKTYGKYNRANNCNMSCLGNQSQLCGQTKINSVYKINSSDIRFLMKYNKNLDVALKFRYRFLPNIIQRD
jgi:hypothetical protein